MDIEKVEQKLTNSFEESYSNFKKSAPGTWDNVFSRGYCAACEYAVELLEDMQNNKVDIPRFVANWIIEADTAYGVGEEMYNPLEVASIINQKLEAEPEKYKWLSQHSNQKLLLKALINGFTVEDNEVRVLIKGYDKDLCYLNFDIDDQDFYLDDKLPKYKAKTEFKKEWLADNWPEYEAYNNTGLLEFEEVEDE